VTEATIAVAAAPEQLPATPVLDVEPSLAMTTPSPSPTAQANEPTAVASNDTPSINPIGEDSPTSGMASLRNDAEIEQTDQNVMALVIGLIGAALLFTGGTVAFVLWRHHQPTE
jgi:hypothetical protein